MLTLFVNGVPALKLSGMSEIPSPQGMEPWRVTDEAGRTVASYQPGRPAKPARRHAAEPRGRFGALSA